MRARGHVAGMGDVRFRAPGTAVALAVLGALASAQIQGSPEEALAALERELAVPALEELAEWCQANKLYGRRSEVYEALVHFAPDHSKAHRSLQHSLRNGAWVPPKKPYAPKDRNESALGAFAEKRAELLAPYGEAVMDAVAELGLEPHGARELVGRLLLADPDAPAAHAFLGDVRLGDRWVMEESATAARRRAELDALWSAALKRAEPALRPTEASAAERALGVSWSTVLASDRVRVLGTVPPAEVRRAATTAHAARELFAALHPLAVELRSTIYLLGDEGTRRAFLANHPGLTEADRTLFAGLTGATLPGGGEVAQWAAEEDQRIDAAVRHAADSFFGTALGIDLSQGWVYEGLGAYLTWRMTGTHRTWRIPASNRDRTDRSGVTIESLFGAPGLDWLALARDTYCADDGLRMHLESVLADPIEDLSPADLLASFALSAYLVEGRSDLGRLLDRVRHSRDSRLAVARALDMSVAELEWRVCRWLAEQGSLEGLAAPALVAGQGIEASTLPAPWTSSGGK